LGAPGLDPGSAGRNLDRVSVPPTWNIPGLDPGSAGKNLDRVPVTPTEYCAVTRITTLQIKKFRYYYCAVTTISRKEPGSSPGNPN